MLIATTELERYWIKVYQDYEAIWKHDGNPKRPHVVVRSKLHSGGFVNSGLVVQNPTILDIATGDLANELKHMSDFIDMPLVRRVIGPAMGAVTLSNDLARNIADQFQIDCLTAYAEKTDTGMVLARGLVEPDEVAIICEDTLTTGDTVEQTILAVEAVGAKAAPLVLVLVNRSGLKEVGGRRIVSLINHHMPTWPADQCPLCKEGSEAIEDPKLGDNWLRLNAQY